MGAEGRMAGAVDPCGELWCACACWCVGWCISPRIYGGGPIVEARLRSELDKNLESSSCLRMSEPDDVGL